MMHMPIPGVCMRYFYIITNLDRGGVPVALNLQALLITMLTGATLTITNSCSTSQKDVDNVELAPVESGVECAPPRIELASGVVWDVREDAPRLLEAERGCIRYYGKGACLTVFYKKSRLNYHAICRRQN